MTPGITIKDRLRVLLPGDPESIYRKLSLVPEQQRELIDAGELEKVIRYLTDPGNDVPPTVVEDARQRVVLNQATVMADALSAVYGLPTYIVPRRKSGTEVQRLGQLADALSHSGLHLTAGSEAREKLVDILDPIVVLGNVVSAGHCLCSAPGTLSGTS